MNSDGQALDTALANERAADEPAFVVDVEGFEGPLDLLLALARQQKVDLAKISILALADQYLAFIEEARKLRLELAADYLLMAAWLAYLKSRLLLPDVTSEEGQNAAALASALALRLKRLEAIRTVAEQLLGRAQLDRDIFRRGQPEPIAHQASGMDGDPVRSPVRLRAATPAQRAFACTGGPAKRLVAGGGTRSARAFDRAVG
jgi:segregation and condensation protein A